jgi:hypothetical protein
MSPQSTAAPAAVIAVCVLLAIAFAEKGACLVCAVFLAGAALAYGELLAMQQHADEMGWE